jgi:streptogramin lyase
LVAACAPQTGQPPNRLTAALSPDSRIVISDFSYVTAVAATPWFVFGATTHGLLIYDRTARRFRTTVTTLDGYPEGVVRRAFADPAANAVWLDLGTASGYYRYDVDGRGWTTATVLSSRAEVLSVETALASAPQADAMRAAILTDARLRTHRFTSAAATPDRPEIFFGTNGMGMVRVDKQTGEWEVLGYGLVAPAVGALAIGRDGVWAAANGRLDRRGLTWVARDLATTRRIDFDFLSSRRLLDARNSLWLATEQGVLRIDPATFQSQRFDLPDATCLARAPDGVWVGTTRGLSIITADDRVVPIGSSGVPIVSLLSLRDTLWVGTTAGLGQVLPGADAITAVPELAERPSLRVPIYALAQLQDTVVLTTDRELLWRNPTTREWKALPLPLGLGRPTAMTVGPGGGLWIGGTQGVAQFDLPRAAMHLHPVPLEIPAAVRDVASDGDYLWVATDSGLVRIQ